MKVNIAAKTAPAYYPAFRDVMTHKHTQYMLKGGRGSLKSSFVSLVIPSLMLSDSSLNALIVRKVGSTLKDSVYNQIMWGFEELHLTPWVRATKNPMEIICDFGRGVQHIYFRGADDPLKLKSIKPMRGYIGITWFEELDQFHGAEEVRSILQSANRGGDRYWNFFSFNPPKSRDNWANQEALIEREDRFTLHTTYLDAPKEWLGTQFFVDAEELQKHNELAYRHEYLGEATGTGGDVFDNLDIRDITDEEISTMGAFYYGVDFGFAIDPFVWLKISYNKQTKTIYILDEIYSPKLTNARAVELIRQHGGDNHLITADSAEPRTISEFNNLGLKVIGAKKGPDSVEHGISWLQGRYHIVIDKRRCPNAAREFSGYEYAQDRYGNFVSAFPDADNHTIDAARYALETIITQRKAGYLSKSKLGVY